MLVDILWCQLKPYTPSLVCQKQSITAQLYTCFCGLCPYTTPVILFLKLLMVTQFHLIKECIVVKCGPCSHFSSCFLHSSGDNEDTDIACDGTNRIVKLRDRRPEAVVLACTVSSTQCDTSTIYEDCAI